MLSFRDGDGRGAEGIIAYERIPKAKFRWESDDRNFKNSKKLENQTKSEPQLCFILRSHSPVRSLRSSHQDAWSCPRPCLVLPGQLHMTWDLFQRHSKHFLLTFRDTLETKKVNKARSNPRSQQHIVPMFLRQRLSHGSDGSLKRGRQRAVDHRARRDHRSWGHAQGQKARGSENQADLDSWTLWIKKYCGKAMNSSDSTIKIQICDTVNPSVVQVYGYTYLHFYFCYVFVSIFSTSKNHRVFILISA